MSDLKALFSGSGASVELPEVPSGRLVWPNARGLQLRDLPAAERPAYWLSDGPGSADLWRRLRAMHTVSGLWPLLLQPLRGERTMPWVAGDVVPGLVDEVGREDAAEFMRQAWGEWSADEDGEVDPDDDFGYLEPIGRVCPDLAPAGVAGSSPDMAADRLAGELDDGRTRIGLAASARSADVLAVVGWMGPINYTDSVSLSVMLRSWEDRFGVRVVRVGFDTLDVSVAAPPMTEEHALHVAAEHFVFCPDNIQQGAGTLREYAKMIKGANSWSFWWD
ncbi:hypothetical protein GCM10022254_38300 [Actinomadura meridiana]|uniref:DUF4253 domain-containing protein n=1 Tax=Actinomadura meridiana TaxID=559626 RepID=A0ABP8C5L6_9ACTN